MRVAVGLVPAYYRLVNFQQARDDWLSAEPQSEQESHYALSSPCQLSTELFGTYCTPMRVSALRYTHSQRSFLDRDVIVLWWCHLRIGGGAWVGCGFQSLCVTWEGGWIGEARSLVVKIVVVHRRGAGIPARVVAGGRCLEAGRVRLSSQLYVLCSITPRSFLNTILCATANALLRQLICTPRT